MNQQPYNIFKPLKVAPQGMEHQGTQQPVTQQAPLSVEADTAGQAAQAEQRARYTQYAMPSTQSEETRERSAMPVIDPNSETSGMDAISQMYTDPREEERMRKASLANQRILAIGDALRHIGNIYNTVRYAPAQKFNSPVLEEYDRYQKGKALRDAANLRYLTYQQQKARQDAQIAKMEHDYQLKLADDKRKDALNDARISRYNAQNSKDEANQAYWETRARLLEEGYPLEKALKEARKAQIEEQTRLTKIKADQGGFAPRSGGRRSGGTGTGDKYWFKDQEGNYHGYGNKTMYEQGIAQYGNNVQQTYQSDTGKKDIYGKPIFRNVRRKPTDIGGQMNREAEAKRKNKAKNATSGNKTGNRFGGTRRTSGSTSENKRYQFQSVK